MSHLISTTIKEVMIDRVVIIFDYFPHYNVHPSFRVNSPTFIVTGDQSSCKHSPGLLQDKYDIVFVWETTASHVTAIR